MESTLVEARYISLQTLGEIPSQVWIVETVMRVVLLHRASVLVVEVLDLAVEPLRLITEDSGVMVEEGSSKSEEDFVECSDNL